MEQQNNYIRQMELMNLRMEQEEKLVEYDAKIKRYGNFWRMILGLMIFAIVLLICFFATMYGEIMGTSDPQAAFVEVSFLLIPFVFMAILPFLLIIGVVRFKKLEKKFIEKKNKLKEKMNNTY